LSIVLEDYESIRYWLTDVSKHTHDIYTRWIRKFCEFTKLDPDGLLGAAGEDKRKVHMQLKDFFHTLQPQGYASGSSVAAYTAIRSFFTHNDCFLGRMPKSFRGVTEFASHRVIGPSEVFAMIMTAPSIRDKAIISFFAQTGQRVGVLCALRYGHVRSQLEDRTNPVIVEVKAGLMNGKGANVNKNKVPYNFAFGRECAEFLRLMIQKRKALGEQIRDESWLFRSMGLGAIFERGKLRVLGSSRASTVGKDMSPPRIRDIVVDVAYDAGIQSRHEFHGAWKGMHGLHDIHPHAFRRWWKARMRLAGVGDIGLLDYMMGHTTYAYPYRGAYDHYDIDYVRREYLKAEPYLSVIPDLKTQAGTAMPNRQIAVSETEVGGLLERGWRFVTTLPSGNVILDPPSTPAALDTLRRPTIHLA